MRELNTSINNIIDSYKGYKKIFIDLKFKTKLTRPKNLAQKQKLPLAKLKEIKSNQSILPKKQPVL